jgi:hypothetical protein
VHGLKEAVAVAEAAVKIPTEVSARLTTAPTVRALSPPLAKIHSAASSIPVVERILRACRGLRAIPVQPIHERNQIRLDLTVVGLTQLAWKMTVWPDRKPPIHPIPAQISLFYVVLGSKSKETTPGKCLSDQLESKTQPS